MNANTALIITSVASPNEAMRQFALGCIKNNVDFFVIGDTKSPSDFKLEGCRFVSIGEQQSLPFSLASLLPEKHYARKNIGYLLAKTNSVIIETDDDNIPLTGFWDNREKVQQLDVIESDGWVNVYRYFSNEPIWPRGFPLEMLKQTGKPAPYRSKVLVPVQQGLANENPDVDAVYRLTQTLPLNFYPGVKTALSPGTWCPFNSQNTTWFAEAFPLLYLPTYCSFRMTDIWRSFVAQRIAWESGWHILFESPTVYQERNEHNLLRDFEEEIPGYLNNKIMCSELKSLALEHGEHNISENMLRCYDLLTRKNWIDKAEMKLLNAWLKDIS